MAIDLDVSQYEFSHVTSVFIESLDQGINLEILTISLGIESVEYEPEQFPGLIYRPKDYDVTLLVFSSGKVSIGGATDREIAQSAIQDLLEKIPNERR